MLSILEAEVRKARLACDAGIPAPETLRIYAAANGVQADSVLMPPSPAHFCATRGVPMFDDGDTQAPFAPGLPLMPYEPWHGPNRKTLCAPHCCMQAIPGIRAAGRGAGAARHAF